MLYNSKIIEPLIALTILYTAIENIFFTEKSKIRYLLIIIFGLIHGLGFAYALKEIGIPKVQFFTCLFSFNFGVELGQIVVILLAYFLISKWFAYESWYKDRVVYPISSIIACVALYWVIERILML